MRIIDVLNKNVFENFKKHPVEIVPLPNSGSRRLYFRILFYDRSIIAVYNKNIKENTAFIEFTKHFQKTGLNVPKILAYNLTENIYFLEDLGDDVFFKKVIEQQGTDQFSQDIFNTYINVIDELIRFQIDAHKGFNYNHCYPIKEFSKKSILWDLYFFKYYYLKLTLDLFEEEILQDEFERFANFLIKAENNYFMYRDFQSRNILLKNNIPYFIDYQGGRKGPLQYDLASLLYQAKAKIPEEIKTKLLTYYLKQINEKKKINNEDFIKYFDGFVLIRILQTIGAYGFRGFYEKKGHFISSLPLALKNSLYIIKKVQKHVQLPYLYKLLKKTETVIPDINIIATNKFNVIINSFSYKKTGIPVDYTEHGGGFVFDCRSLPNPYHEINLRHLTGKDQQIIDFMKNKPEVDTFISSAYCIIEQSIKKYLDRGFNSLNISFGCTGGHHRSVYCTEKVGEMIKQKYNVIVKINHIELDKENE